MSTKRREPSKRVIVDGVTLCSCGCGQVPQPPRRTWFSDACVEQWRAINDPAYIRQELKKRDKGICAICGCDSEAEFRSWQAARKEAARLFSWLESREEWRTSLAVPREHRHDWHLIAKAAMWPDCLKGGKPCYKKVAIKKDAEIVRLMGPRRDGWTSGRSTAWDADHIVPVAEGGGLCGLENYRTLCHPCHKRVTAELAARLAQRRKQSAILLP